MSVSAMVRAGAPLVVLAVSLPGCAIGVEDTQGARSSDAGRIGEIGSDAGIVGGAIDGGSCEDAGGALACECLSDLDADGTSDCEDECPMDDRKQFRLAFYPDCDGDGDASPQAAKTCDVDPGNLTSTCANGMVPDGGWTLSAGTDCDDEKASVSGPGGCVSSPEPKPKPKSCLELLTLEPKAADGDYELDPDGSGPGTPFKVRCDLTGGGWTEIDRDDFNLADASGWHGDDNVPTPVDTSSTCAVYYGPMLGGLGILGMDTATQKTFGLLGIPHTEAEVRLSYLVLESWDGELATVEVSGSTNFVASFNQAVGAAASTCGEGYPDHGPQQVTLRVPAHMSDSISVRVSSTLDEPAVNEAFGVDDVLVRVR